MSSCQSCGTALATDTCFCQSCGSPTEIKVSPRAVEGSADGAVMSPPGKTEPKMMDTNVVAALTYLAGFLTGIIFLALDPYKSNSFVRFHAFQSIFVNVAWLRRSGLSRQWSPQGHFGRYQWLLQTRPRRALADRVCRMFG